MSQAAIDLPETDSAPAALNSADDLLSKLAGEEIDRLLAESESAPKPAAAASPATAPATATVATEEPASVIEPTPVTPPEAAAPEKEPAGEDPFSAEVDELFRQLQTNKDIQAPAKAELPVAQPEQSEPQKPELTAKVETPLTSAPEPVASTPAAPAVIEPEESTTTAERAALESIAASDKPVEAQPARAESAEPRVAFYVRILELINGPFAQCPAPLRDTLGKAAILTLMNAVGVLIYVLLFRK